MSLRNVLIITYYWPPSGGAGVQRWLKFAKYLPQFGWKSFVYTPLNPEAPSTDTTLLKDIPDEVVVIKKPIWEPYLLYKKFTGKKKSDKISAGFIEEKKSNKFLEKLSVFIRGNFLIPDPRRYWVKPSVKYLQKYIAENKIKHIITTGPPHSMHLIGLKLKERTNINWIADFRDPWTNIDFYKDLMLTKASDRRHKKLEKMVLANADCVLTVGPTMTREMYDLGAKKVKTITNGYDHEDIDGCQIDLDSKFTILHAGSLNKDRNHPVLWNVLKELCRENDGFKNNLEIKLIGKVDIEAIEMIKERNMIENLNQIEYIPHNEIPRHLLASHLLYLPINNSPNAKGILTGKFFEYLAVQRPILTIGLEDSDVADILRETNAGQVFDFNNHDGIKQFINNTFVKFLNKMNVIQRGKVDKYSRISLAKDLAVTLNELNNGK